VTLTVTLAAISAALLVACLLAARWAAHRPDTPTIEVVLGDITHQTADAIVNAAKPSLLGGGGVDGAIHRAGGPAILSECQALRAEAYPNGLAAGQAVATTAGNLTADWVIHTVGPVYSSRVDLSAQLRACYAECLRVADALGATVVAFPLISSGVYGWPVQDAIRQALTALTSTPTNVRTARLVLFDEETYWMTYKQASVLTH
jgi:O-acetyl-ADP-ribose deacetylase (regulator of RNase III)